MKYCEAEQIHNLLSICQFYFYDIKVIDSNVEKYKEADKLYFVTPFISGYNLSDYINEKLILHSADNILTAFNNLLDIVNYCHNNNVIHRDIKPDNIMCQNDDINNLVLIDFGLSFNLAEDIELTPSLQHVGNRFLSLPEHQNGNKRDIRSDITQLCGILFFMLTGILPTNLQDEENSMPHQRGDSKKMFLVKFNEKKLEKINKIFDKAFQININHRYQSIESLKNDTTDTINIDDTDSKEVVSMDSILNKLSEKNYNQNDNIYKILNEVSDSIRGVHTNIHMQLGKSANIIGSYQTGFDRNYSKFYIKNTLGFTNLVTDKKASPTFEIKYSGSELIVDVIFNESKKELLRSSIEEYQTNKESLWENVNIFYLEILNDIL